MSRFSNWPTSRRKRANRERLRARSSIRQSRPPSRVGRKAISGYFSPEMSLALHTCARRNGVNLQALMAEAFDDVLRKYGESPIGR